MRVTGRKGAGRTRREILKAGAAGAVGTAALSAGFPSIVRAADTVRIGYVSPKTGPLAPFADADEFNVRLGAGGDRRQGPVRRQ